MAESSALRVVALASPWGLIVAVGLRLYAPAHPRYYAPLVGATAWRSLPMAILFAGPRRLETGILAFPGSLGHGADLPRDAALTGDNFPRMTVRRPWVFVITRAGRAAFSPGLSAAIAAPILNIGSTAG